MGSWQVGQRGANVTALSIGQPPRAPQRRRRVRRARCGSVAETALARAQIATAALAARWTSSATPERLTAEGISGAEHVTGCRKDLWRGRGARRAPPAGARRRPIVGIVDTQSSAAEVVAVEAANRIGRLGVGAVFDEGESPRPTGLAVRADVYAYDASRFTENL
jgi:hypothetical protein